MKPPRLLELFCGTKSMAAAFEKRGCDVITLDNNQIFNPDICADILTWNRAMLPVSWRPDFVWASPPCTGFSNAAGGKYWIRRDGYWVAKLPEGGYYLELIYRILAIIKELKPRYWFIENPVSLLRNLPVLWGYPRATITYCQYGENRRKPTDIWNNCAAWLPRPPCKPGSPCHERVPHETHSSGVMRQSNSRERSKLPLELCEEIAGVCIGTQLEKGGKR